jgi:acyl carrier protein
VAGELCISGAAVARGYLNRPGLTLEKFIADPYRVGERLYRTGDLACWSADGNIEFLGRLDNQVKIRGFRIELGEIENELLNHDRIKEAAVAAKKDQNGENYLCAYIISDVDIPASELRPLLLKRLPDYMVPSYFVRLDKLPLTTSGKVDRKSMPEPDQEAAGRYAAPRDEVEKKLSDIWAEILGIEKNAVGIDANFFELGGHSLKATLLVSKIQKTFNLSVSLNDIFSAPTLRELAKSVKVAAADKYLFIRPVEKKDYYTISSSQERYYILQQLNADNASYHITETAELEGSLDIEKFDEVFVQLIKRHESLRTAFQTLENKIVQKVHYGAPFNLEYYELEEEEVKDIANRFFRPFNMSKAPLFRAGFIKLEKERHILMIDMHHIIADGVSLGILIKELMALYGGEELPGIPIQVKDFSGWQNKLYQSRKLQKQEQYWLDKFKGTIPVLKLPTDFPRTGERNLAGDSVFLEINPRLTSEINNFISATQITLNMLLTAVYNILLSKLTQQEDIIVGSLTTGRSHMELQNIVGLFLNSIALRNYPEADKTFAAFLAEVKENIINAYENQDYPFNQLVLKLGIKAEADRAPLFDTLLTMHNFDIPEIEIPGLMLKPYKLKSVIPKFDLYLDAVEKSDTIHLVIKYSTALYKRTTVEKMMAHYIGILEQVIKDREIKLKEIMLSHDLLDIKTNRFLEDETDFKI